MKLLHGCFPDLDKGIQDYAVQVNQQLESMDTANFNQISKWYLSHEPVHLKINEMLRQHAAQAHNASLPATASTYPSAEGINASVVSVRAALTNLTIKASRLSPSTPLQSQQFATDTLSEHAAFLAALDGVRSVVGANMQDAPHIVRILVSLIVDILSCPALLPSAPILDFIALLCGIAPIDTPRDMIFPLSLLASRLTPAPQASGFTARALSAVSTIPSAAALMATTPKNLAFAQALAPHIPTAMAAFSARITRPPSRY